LVILDTEYFDILHQARLPSGLRRANKGEIQNKAEVIQKKIVGLSFVDKDVLQITYDDKTYYKASVAMQYQITGPFPVSSCIVYPKSPEFKIDNNCVATYTRH